MDEAIVAYQRLLAVKPDLADSWYNLGWLQKQSRRFEDALESYIRALGLGVSGAAEVHVNRAIILSDHLHRPEDARAELEQALSIDPNYVPALLNLGNLDEDEGLREDARSAYRSALQLDPTNPLALARLAGVSHSKTLDTELAERLARAIAAAGGVSAARADLGFALGGLLDSAGEYDRAFAAYADANQASKNASGAVYDRRKSEGMIDGLIASLTAAADADRLSSEYAPVFVCGLFRSGSTLVERILATDANVVAGGELDLVPALAQSIAGYPEALRSANVADVVRWREAYLDALPERPAQGRLVVDKRPDNFLHLGLIKLLFPSARIVHTRRAALDNILSLYFLHLDPGMAFALDLQDAAHWYRQYDRLMVHSAALYGSDLLTVDYDRLVREPETETQRLFEFCGLDWSPSALEFQTGAGSVKTASVWQVREPLYARSSGRWRNYQAHLQPIIDLAPADGHQTDRPPR